MDAHATPPLSDIELADIAPSLHGLPQEDLERVVQELHQRTADPHKSPEKRLKCLRRFRRLSSRQQEEENILHSTAQRIHQLTKLPGSGCPSFHFHNRAVRSSIAHLLSPSWKGPLRGGLNGLDHTTLIPPELYEQTLLAEETEEDLIRRAENLLHELGLDDPAYPYMNRLHLFEQATISSCHS
ncbi:MAG: hypothetical protein WCV62_00605 [Candidatus Peribacteraceae bacterium]|jgi:hypothetical protein